MSDIRISARSASGAHVVVDALTIPAKAWTRGRVASTNVMELAVDALLVGFHVDHAWRAPAAVPSVAELVEGYREKFPEMAAMWEPGAREPITQADHRGQLQALRGRLMGPDKTAVRWALTRLEKLEARLDWIARTARSF